MFPQKKEQLENSKTNNKKANLITKLEQKINRKIDLKRIGILSGVLVAFIAVAVLIPVIVNNKNKQEAVVPSVQPTQIATPTPQQEEVIEEIPIEYVDLSAHRTQIVTEMNRINEPIPFGKNIIYSAGHTTGINEIVFDKLYVYDTETQEEIEVAKTQLTNKLGRVSGELYEGRMNDKWIVWLDTNQSGTNNIYGLNRTNPDAQPFLIKKAELIRPQLRLAGDNLIWVEQASAGEDIINLYNFEAQEPVALYYFMNPTYGTCPPAVNDNMVVWVKPDLDDETKTIINALDLSKELDITPVSQASEEGSGDGEALADDGTGAEAPADTGADGSGEEVETPPEFDPSEIEIIEPTDEELEDIVLEQPEVGEEIDPEGFAIYPATNGEVIAWLDNLNPINATLKIKIGDKILEVESGVGRFYGIGDDFVAYTKNDGIYLYFWETETHATLTTDEEVGRLSQECVSGNTVIWYGNDPKQDDVVYVSVIEDPSK